MRVQSAQFGGYEREGQDCGQWLRRSACLSCLVTVSPGASSHLRVFVSSCCRALQGEEGNRRCGIVMDMVMFIVSSLGHDRPNSSVQALRLLQGRAGPGTTRPRGLRTFAKGGSGTHEAQWTCVCTYDRLESRDAAVYRRGLAGHLTRTYDICGCGTVTSGIFRAASHVAVGGRPGSGVQLRPRVVAVPIATA